jgi:hypothetical protein
LDGNGLSLLKSKLLIAVSKKYFRNKPGLFLFLKSGSFFSSKLNFSILVKSQLSDLYFFFCKVVFLFKTLDYLFFTSSSVFVKDDIMMSSSFFLNKFLTFNY